MWVSPSAPYVLTGARAADPSLDGSRSAAAAGISFREEPAAASDVLLRAPVGSEVKLAVTEVPPWIVVHASVADLTISQWPGRLLRVEVIEPVSLQDADATRRANEHFLPSAAHRRVLAVRISEECTRGTLFGPGGAEIVEILDRAAELTAADLEDLLVPADELEEVRRRVVASVMGSGSPFASRDIVGAAGDAQPPFGNALLILHQLVVRQAVLAGAGYWDVDDDDDDDDEPDLVLLPAWSRAGHALTAAVWAMSADGRADPDDLEVLRAPWRALASRR